MRARLAVLQVLIAAGLLACDREPTSDPPDLTTTRSTSDHPPYGKDVRPPPIPLRDTTSQAEHIGPASRGTGTTGAGSIMGQGSPTAGSTGQQRASAAVAERDKPAERKPAAGTWGSPHRE